MSESLAIAAKVAVPTFVVSSMIAVGLGLGLRDLAAPLRRPRLVILALAANFGIAPLIALALTEIIPLDRPYAIGLILLGVAAGAPFLPKLAVFAKGDIAYSVSLMLLLTVGSVIFLPILLPIMIPGVAASPRSIALPLLLTMLLPLAAAIALRSQKERWSLRLQPVFKMVSSISMFLSIALLIGLNFGDMVSTFGSGAAATAMVFVALCLGAGYALGGPSIQTRSVLGLGTGQRNIAAALVIATQNFTDPAVSVMVLIATFAGLIVLLFAARRFARRSAESASRPSGSVGVDSKRTVMDPIPSEVSNDAESSRHSRERL